MIKYKSLFAKNVADRSTTGSQIVTLMNQSHLNQPDFVCLISRLVLFICLTAVNLIAQESQQQAAVSVHLDEQEPFRAAEAGFEISGMICFREFASNPISNCRVGPTWG